MKLCIVKPDGTVAEILLRDRQPSFEAFNNEQLFFENVNADWKVSSSRRLFCYGVLAKG